MLFQAFPYFPDNQPEMYSTNVRHQKEMPIKLALILCTYYEQLWGGGGGGGIEYCHPPKSETELLDFLVNKL